MLVEGLVMTSGTYYSFELVSLITVREFAHGLSEINRTVTISGAKWPDAQSNMM
jgi:hypothetical protein